MLDLVPLYALDALESPEREEFESHLESCPECAAELARHHSVTAAFVADQDAPSHVWDRIVNEIFEGEPSIEVAQLAPRMTRRFQPLAWVASIAALAALVLGTLAFLQADRLNDLAGAEGVFAAAQAAAEQPGAVVANLDSPAGTVARVVLTPEGEGFFLPEGLEALPEDRTYQLWVIPPEQVAISAGVFGHEPGPVRFTWDGDVAGFALTREVAGGVASTEGDVVSIVEL